MTSDRIYVPNSLIPYCGNCYNDKNLHIRLVLLTKEDYPEIAQAVFEKFYHDHKYSEDKNLGMIRIYECPKCYARIILEIIGDVYSGEVKKDGSYTYDIPEATMGS